MSLHSKAVEISVPGSKSEAIRALILGALARGTTRIEGAPASDDVLAVLGAIRALGVRVDGVPGRGALRVRGTAGRLPPGDRRLDLGGSATGLRLLTCVSLLRRGETTLTGDRSLLRRGVGPIFDLFPSLGVSLRARGGCPPVRVSGGPVKRLPGTLKVRCDETSQIPSGMLIAGPHFEGGGQLQLEGDRVVSRPYVDMTVAVLRRAGVRIEVRGRRFRVHPGLPRGVEVRVEPDWSSAAYPLVAAAILGRSVRVPGLREDSHQADARVLELLRTAGVRCGVDSKGAWCRGTGRVRPFRIDIRGSPDLGPAAAALALFAEGESRITGALAIHLKESNRMEACIAAIRSLGGRAAGIHHTVVKVAPRPGISDRRSLADGLVVRGGTPRAGTVDSRGDHRIALAFGVAAAAIPGARVLRRGCVAKSWPGAWDDLAPLLRGGSRVVSLPRPSGRG